MNLPNLLTLSRVPLMFLIAALLYMTWDGHVLPGGTTAALVLFIIAGVTDWADGYIARKRGQVSSFGIYMDALTDKIFMLGVMVALVAMEEHRPLLAPVLVILTREFLITGMRLIAAHKGVVVAAEKAGKQKTVTQIIAVGAILLELALERDVNVWLGLGSPDWFLYVRFIGYGLFLLATYMTVRSGLDYLRKYSGLFRE